MYHPKNLLNDKFDLNMIIITDKDTRLKRKKNDFNEKCVWSGRCRMKTNLKLPTIRGL